MNVSRRDLLKGASIAALAASSPDLAQAWMPHGIAPGTEKSVLNIAHAADIPFKNVLLTATGGVSPGGTTNANGYPLAANTFTSGNFTAVTLPSNYFGKFRISWTGEMALSAPIPFTVNASAGSQSNTSGSTFLGVLPAAPNNFVEFDFSAAISGISDSGISNGSGGTLILVTTTSRGVGGPIQVQVTGAGGGANGTWTASQIAATTFALLGSTFTSTAGAAGRINFYLPSSTWSYSKGSSTFSPQMGNLVLCMSGISPTGVDHINDWVDAQSLDPSRMFNQDFINLYKAMNPGIIRTLDVAGTNNSTISQYAYTMPVGRVSYSQDLYFPDLWAGAITSSPSGLTYTCAATAVTPATWTDGEQFQGVLDAVPTKFNILATTQGASNGTGGFFIRFQLSSGDVTSITGAARITVVGINQGGVQPTGNNGTGIWAFNVVDATHIDITTNPSNNVSVYGTTYGPGGYLMASTINCGASGSRLPKLLVDQRGMAPLFSTGLDTVTRKTCIYNKILDAVIIAPAGISSHWPLAVRVACCNKLNAHYWHLFPHQYDMAATSPAAMSNVISETNYIAANLNSNLHAYFEYGNEVWNPGFFQYGLCYWSSVCFDASNSTLFGQASFVALRNRLTFGAIESVWGRGSLRRIFPWQTVGITAGGIDQLYNGVNLIGATYPLYASFGYSNYNAAPNRPIDKTEAIGCAPYIQGAIVKQKDGLSGTYSNLDLQQMIDAADNFASGVPANITKAFAWLDNDIKQGTSSTIAITSISGASNDTFNTATPHGFANGSAMAFSLASGGTFYTGGIPAIAQVYYIVSTASTSFKLALTPGGAAITGITGGSGVQIGLIYGLTLLWYSGGTTYSSTTSILDQFAATAFSFGKKFICYEGGYQGGPAISTANCVSYNSTNANLTPVYGGTEADPFGFGGKVYDLIYAYKNSANFKAIVLKQWSDIQAAMVKAGGLAANAIPSWYTSSGYNGNYNTTTATCTSSGTTTLTVAASPAPVGYIANNSIIYNTNGVYIVSQLTSALPNGALGGAGTYQTSAATTLSGSQLFTPQNTGPVADYPWAMLETDLYGTPQVFQSYSAMKQWNNT